MTVQIIAVNDRFYCNRKLQKNPLQMRGVNQISDGNDHHVFQQKMAVNDRCPFKAGTIAVVDPGFPVGGHAPVGGAWTSDAGAFW